MGSNLKIPPTAVSILLVSNQKGSILGRERERESSMTRGAQMIFSLLLTCIFASNVVRKSQAIWLTLPKAARTKCVSEEIHNNVVVLGDYIVVSDDPTHDTSTISVKVRFIPNALIISFFFPRFFNTRSWIISWGLRFVLFMYVILLLGCKEKWWHNSTFLRAKLLQLFGSSGKWYVLSLCMYDWRRIIWVSTLVFICFWFSVNLFVIN